MAESSLQERLRDHAKAFDGLLSLIPAKMYYGEDNSDQWQKKKQTKAEAAAARRNKLDPDSELNRSVKEVMDEQARKKRKREQQDGDEDDWSDVDGIDAETPRQGLKTKAQKDAKKKQKTVDDETSEMTEKERRKEEKKQARKERKAERQMLREEEAAFQRQTIKGVNKVKLGARQTRTESDNAANSSVPNGSAQPPSESIETDEPEPVEESDMQDVDVTGITFVDGEQNGEDISTSPSEPQSPVFDANGTPAESTGQASSTTTSVSSTVAPSEKPKHIKIPQDTAVLRERLAAKIQALRDARKADRDGKPIRTRQELIEARRQKEMERKAHKKELRKQQKVEADRLREEALASARNSPGSILSPAIVDADTNFSFGRVAFADGTQLSQDLTHSLNRNKKKGPLDPKTALQKLENQKKRLEEMEAEKRKDIEDKEVWLTARRRAEGEKIKDDERLLKKAVKRKEVAKKKSTKEWGARAEGVSKAIREKQRKREENIQKRRDEKLLGKAGGKKKGGKAGSSGAKKPKGRAGFEGSFKVGGKKR